MTRSTCSTCGRHIEEGQGRYVTDAGIYCCQCGLPFPLGPNVKVTITVLDPEGKLDRYQHTTES